MPFLCTHLNGKPCLIVPEISADCVRITFLYGLKRKALAPRSLAAVDAASLVKDWRSLARAYVIIEMCPTLVGIDHHASVRAANELLDPYFPYLPTASEIDQALGTTLAWSAKPKLESVHALTFNR